MAGSREVLVSGARRAHEPALSSVSRFANRTGQTHHLKVKVPIAAELDGQLPHVRVRKEQKWGEYWLEGGEKEEERILGQESAEFPSFRAQFRVGV